MVSPSQMSDNCRAAEREGNTSLSFSIFFLLKNKGLALDWPNERLYWVDAKIKTIESCKLDGSNRHLVVNKVSKHPFGIAVFQDTLFWSDWDSRSIQSCDKFTGKNRTTVIRDSVIYDVHVYHPALQRSGRNPCLDSACSHLCLLNMNIFHTHAIAQNTWN